MSREGRKPAFSCLTPLLVTSFSLLANQRKRLQALPCLFSQRRTSSCHERLTFRHPSFLPFYVFLSFSTPFMLSPVIYSVPSLRPRLQGCVTSRLHAILTEGLKRRLCPFLVTIRYMSTLHAPYKPRYYLIDFKNPLHCNKNRIARP